MRSPPIDRLPWVNRCARPHVRLDDLAGVQAEILPEPPLLDELAAAWPPDEGPVMGGYVRPPLADARPVAATPIRGDGARGLAVVVAERPDGRLQLAPLVREDGRWRRARPRDGASTALIEALDREADLAPGFRVRRLRAAGGLRGERAIGVDQDKKFVLVVSPDSKANYREIKLGASVDGGRIVTSGLNPGERIIVDGLQKVRSGALIAPQADRPGASAALQTQQTSASAEN